MRQRPTTETRPQELIEDDEQNVDDAWKAPAMTGLPASMSTMRRPHEGRVVLGVCAAIARRLDLDPTLVRIVAAICLFVLTMPTIVAYAGLALVVPRDDGRMLIGGDPKDRRESILGWAIVALAAGLVIATPSIVWIGGGADGWGIGLLVIAVALIAWAMGRNDDRPSVAATPGGSPEPANPAPATAAAGPVTAPTAVAATAATAVQPASERPTAPLPPDPATYEPPAPRKPSIFVPVAAAIVGLIGFAAVIVSVFGLAVTPVTVAVVAGFAAIASCGVAIASFGRRGAVPLLVMGLLFAIVASVSAIGRDEFDRGIGYREINPVTVSEVEQGYDHGVGFMEIDLRDVELPPGETTMPVHIGWGAAEIRVPDDLRVIASGDNISGDLPVETSSTTTTATGTGAAGRDAGPAANGGGSGSGNDGGAGGSGTGGDAGSGAPDQPPTLIVDSEVGVGAIEISRGAGHGWGPD